MRCCMYQKTTRLRVQLDLSRMPLHEKMSLSGAVYNGLKGNPAYTDCPVNLDTFKDAIGSFTHALAGMVDGGRNATAEKNRQEEILDRMLRHLARYVEHACKDNLETLLSSGFPAVSNQTSPTPLLTESIRKIMPGPNSGTALIRLVAVRGARSYQVSWAPENAKPDAWEIRPILNTRPATLIDGLVRGTTYLFKARALTASGYSDWSDPVTWTCT